MTLAVTIKTLYQLNAFLTSNTNTFLTRARHFSFGVYNITRRHDLRISNRYNRYVTSQLYAENQATITATRDASNRRIRGIARITRSTTRSTVRTTNIQVIQIRTNIRRLALL